eukprot:g6151.t1 g6151   contig20:932897-933469(-)
MSSSPARTSPSSSVCDARAVPNPLVQSSTGTWQPRRPPRKPNPSSVKPTVSTISQTPKKPSSGCMPSVVSQSSQRGSKQYRLATSLALLTVKSIQKYYPETTETSKGHVTDTQNVRSTKPKPFKPSTPTHSVARNSVTSTPKSTMSETIFSDQTGQFPPALSGNRYIMVLVEIDSSCILVEPMKAERMPK